MTRLAKITTTTFLILALTCGQTLAFTGAQFLNGNEQFSDGYAWGIIEFHSDALLIGETQFSEEQLKLRNCFETGHITSNSFGNAVRSYIRSHINTYPVHAIVPISATVREMCQVGLRR
jgi:hypothetical protein